MPKKKTLEEFIADARRIHGDRYDYSQVHYVDSQTKVTIICKKHGPFEQKPNSHIQGQGCPACSGRKRKTTEEFIEQARAIHGDFYNYDKVVYVNDREKVIVTCPKHGDFLISPDAHIHSKQGCKLCAHEKIGLRSRLSLEDFVRRARDVHGDFYIYDKVEYRDSHTRVTITCPVHGDFKQLPYQHLNGHGCKKCATELTISKESISTEEFIKRARACHTIEYDYSQVEMTGMNNPVYITCPYHGGFWQIANTHLQGCDCPKCGYIQNSIKRTKPVEKFIEQAVAIHGDKYDYSETEYVNAKKKVAIRCRKHNKIFWQKPNAHLNGNGCPLCAQSHLETDILQLLQSQGINYEAEKTFDWLVSKNKMFLDYFLPEYGVAIECQGEQHFHACDFYGGRPAFKNTRLRDELKKQLCEEHGIAVIYYTNLDYDYPYPLIKDTAMLLKIIKSRGIVDSTIQWEDPKLPFEFND
jgi:hypothetical protein